MLRELLRRLDMMVIYENKLDAFVRLHALATWKIGHAHQPRGGMHNLTWESFYGPNAGLSEIRSCRLRGHGLRSRFQAL